jgi:vacuolar ATPase assembly integral membrane protein VMA21
LFVSIPAMTAPGNANFAAISAVIIANLVLVAYIVTSLLEDRSPSLAEESKKER